MKRCKPILFLVGPTASGKSEISLCLARRLGGEIISADSMLVYKGMDIGTAKPSRRERRKVRHHLIDVVSPRANFSIYQYRRLALQAIRKILKRGKLPLVVGGSGLYVEALLEGLSMTFKGSEKFRKELIRMADRKGPAFLYARLQKIDPVRAAELHPNDKRRIVRALEIAEFSGKKPSEWFGRRKSLEDLGFSVRIFGIERDRPEIYERINRRVRAMFQKGFLNEVRRLKRKGFSKTAGQGLGYREILEWESRGGPCARPNSERRAPTRGAPTELVGLIQRNTRHFAKRQLTWFRRDRRIEWIPWKTGESAKKICDKIVSETRRWLGTAHFS